ncbi:MAG TPA: ROK family protein [Anaerolineaceae bacterium]|nr:ROK family protein [Anaerolineaceae bacterium]
MSVIGVDIGGTKIASVLVDETGSIVSTDYRMTGVEYGEQATIDSIAKSILKLVAIDPAARGIGIDVPGQVDPASGTVRNAVNLGWDEVKLQERLAAYLPAGVPISIERDTYAQTLGEHIFGVGQGEQNMVYLSLGSGLGAGAMVDGQLLRGSIRSALEVGHLAMTGLQLRCACGNTGCAETILSGPGLVRTFQSQAWNPDLPSPWMDRGDLTAHEILEAAKAGDLRAAAVVEYLGRYLGEMCANLAMILNPSLIVIGGGFGLAAYEQVITPAWEEMKLRSLAQNHQCLTVKKSGLSSSGLGAAALVWHFDRMSQEGGGSGLKIPIR